MKIQDLKNNRSEIIERIKEVGDASKMKEIMTAMIRIVEAEMNESDDVISLVDEVVEMQIEWKKQHVSTLWGHGCKYSTQAEYQRAQLGSKFN